VSGEGVDADAIDLETIAERHIATGDGERDWCRTCSTFWPCDAAALVQRVRAQDALRDVLQRRLGERNERLTQVEAALRRMIDAATDPRPAYDGYIEQMAEAVVEAQKVVRWPETA